mmetsp:Transcript_21993/g.34479  ORF Transcript_21993/g.34479 Transcript_21993/m.34479 type:complete len:164 (-) Transcript_21993:1001-1492(-)
MKTMRKLANWCLVFLACLVMMARQAQSTSYTASSFTSVTAAADEKLLAKVPEADPYVGTKLGTLREGYCTNLSDVGSPTVADLLERIEEQTQKLSKYFFMTGKLPVSVLISLIKASKASRVLELGAYTGSNPKIQSFPSTASRLEQSYPCFVCSDSCCCHVHR